jgi:hypothetical protein
VTAYLVHAALIWLCLILLMFWASAPFLASRPARFAIAVAAALVIGLIPLPLLGSVYATLAGGLWPLSAALAVGLIWQFEAGLRGKSSFSDRDYLAFCSLVVLAGLLIIPGTLFHSLPDSYALGFQGLSVPAFMAAMLAFALLARSWLIVMWVGLASVWSLAGINPGLNLWDSLVDPVVFVSAILGLVVTGGRLALSRKS